MPKKNEIEKDAVNTPRGDFNLLGVKKDKKPKKKYILVIGGGVLFLIISIGFIAYFTIQAFKANNPDKVDESLVKADAALAAKPVVDDDIQKKRDQIVKQRQQEQQKQEEQAVQPPPQGDKPNAAQVEVQPSAAFLRKLAGGVTVQETGGGGNNSSYSTNADEQAPKAAPTVVPVTAGDSDGILGAPADNTRGNLSDLKGSSYAPATAYMSPDRKFLLKRKSNLRCSLYTAVKTDHPGFVKCILTQPLYSSDGSVIIAEAGAELDGEQKVEIKPGQTSVFTTWTDLETTVGVRANLNALGTGAMGESGTEAYIDNHYGKRFGGAVMLSFIQDAFASAANATKQNSSTYSFDNSSSNAENMASKALENSINIPPTGYVLPGTVINVIVAQDVDFSSVFKTRPGGN